MQDFGMFTFHQYFPPKEATGAYAPAKHRSKLIKTKTHTLLDIGILTEDIHRGNTQDNNFTRSRRKTV